MKEFSEIWGLCCFQGSYFFSKKSTKNSIRFWRFFQKINVLRFKMVSNRKLLRNFHEITYTTPNRPFLENFEKIWNFDPQNLPISIFISSLRKKFGSRVLFYESIQPILCSWDPPPPEGSVPPRIALLKNYRNVSL